jgi:hypothetical protein
MSGALRAARLGLPVVTVVFVFATASSTGGVVNAPLDEAPLADLWIDPGSASPRNLIYGVGGRAAAPEPEARYEIVETDPAGFSITYRVKDGRGREWNVKVGPEAQSEVAASRIVWALGYHQVPSYFVERWIAVENGRAQTRGGARFRPRDFGLEGKGQWAWRDNPFLGTRPFKGLLVLMMVLNSTDLKDVNNEVYEVVDGPREGARRWFVVKDLGASLGETGKMEPRRNYIDGFEREPFITGVNNGRVEFGFRGRHQDLLRPITTEDVAWTSRRLLAITDRQWRDAFRAGGFDDALAARFVARIKLKAHEGLARR